MLTRRGRLGKIRKSMRKKPPPVKPARPRWRAALAVGLTLAIVGGIVLSFDWLGGEALRRIGLRGRYRVPFSEIECDPPAGLTRTTFLTEVRYLSNFPESFHAVDETERRQLAEAFARHPWVESVEGVEVEPGNVVRVKSKYRVPALAIRVDRGAVRLVDAHGVLLPESPMPREIVEVLNVVPVPKVNAGEVWPDEIVQQALDLMKSYSLASLERIPAGWRLTMRDGTSLLVAK